MDLFPKLIDQIYQYLRNENLQTHYFRYHMAGNQKVADIFYKKFMKEANAAFETD